jgi:hypothetical protein
VKTEVETGVMYPQAKDCCSPQEVRKSKQNSSIETSRTSMALLTL